jgi:cytochrome b561
VPAFALALVHGVFSGTDSQEPWMFWTYVTTGLAVLFLVVVRGLTAGYRPERAARPAAGERSRPAAVSAPATEG